MEEELIDKNRNRNRKRKRSEIETEPEEPEPEQLSETETESQCKIDPEKLDKLMQLCKEEYPHIPEYFIYTYSVDHLMENNNEI